MELTKGVGADAVLECVGTQQSMMQAIRSARKGGFVSYVGVRHIDDPEPWLRQSPISYVHEMTTPLLILHSENDLRCPVNQAEELFVALRLLGRTPEFVRFPGETHELSRSGTPRHRVQRAEVIIDFFRRNLLP